MLTALFSVHLDHRASHDAWSVTVEVDDLEVRLRPPRRLAASPSQCLDPPNEQY
jgi:hypothetical protein